MTIRTADSLCTVCLFRKANATGSHFAPAGLIKGTIGGRDQETAVTIDPDGPQIEHHYGRGNLNNTNPEPTPNPHVRDHIFCTLCEKDLSRYESAVLPFLNGDLQDAGKRAAFLTSAITSEANLLEPQKVHRNVFNLFFYSVAYRICLQQRLENNNCIVSANFEDQLRITLTRYLPMSVVDLGKVEINWPYDFSILTCAENTVDTATFINPNSQHTNPYLFYMGPLIALFYHNDSAVNAKVSTLPPEIIDRRYANTNTAKNVRMVQVSLPVWEKVHLGIVEYGRQQLGRTLCRGICASLGVSPDEAMRILEEKADRIAQQESVEWSIAAIKAHAVIVGKAKT